MTQEDKELLIKDLCCRLPYKIKVEYDEEVCTLESIEYFDFGCYVDNYEEKMWYCNVEDIKPYLFPLSSMTNEQRDRSKFELPCQFKEEERTILFDKLQEKGYFWNGETKSLEKYKFKVGDKIQDKVSKQIYTIYDIEHAKYKVNVNEDIQGYLFAAFQNQFELYKEKFDITTLKPYDKVLIRRTDNGPWEPQLFSYLNNDKSFYLHRTVIVGSSSVKQCIPYEGNEHLVGTTNECNEYYKTWN